MAGEAKCDEVGVAFGNAGEIASGGRFVDSGGIGENVRVGEVDGPAWIQLPAQAEAEPEAVGVRDAKCAEGILTGDSS